MSSNTSIALITGGGRGLGKNMALKIADSGIDLIVTYKSGEKEARDVVEQIQKKGRKAVALQLDVGDSRSYGAFAEAVRAELKKTWSKDAFDFLVNNAGTGLHASILETTEEQFDELYNVHLKSVFFLTQKLLPIINDGGRIVNISSGLARFSFPGSSAYAAMKGGVEVLTRYMAAELAKRQISVNTLAPGAIETDFRGGAVRDNPEVNKAVAAHTALGRVGLPDDIGGIVAFLVSPASKWITGQRIEASGGMML
jgi:NAD(P)-dependent dehydrogenase (short-subunit alcohol dehydrogenase family)